MRHILNLGSFSTVLCCPLLAKVSTSLSIAANLGQWDASSVFSCLGARLDVGSKHLMFLTKVGWLLKKKKKYSGVLILETEFGIVLTNERQVSRYCSDKKKRENSRPSTTVAKKYHPWKQEGIQRIVPLQVESCTLPVNIEMSSAATNQVNLRRSE